MKNSLMLAIGLLLLFVNWLAFHDLFEQHSLRDWLTLFTSVLIFFYFVKEFPKKLRHHK